MTFTPSMLAKLPHLLATAGAILFSMIWVPVAVEYFARGNFDALWLLGIFTIPLGPLSHLLVSWVHHAWLPNRDLYVILDFVGLWVAGTIQYSAIGYLVGKGGGKLLGLVRVRSMG